VVKTRISNRLFGETRGHLRGCLGLLRSVPPLEVAFHRPLWELSDFLVGLPSILNHTFDHPGPQTQHIATASKITTSQLFSILTSNPNLREVVLSHAALPDDADGSTSKALLRDLKKLSLTRVFRHVFGSLHRLMLPEMLDEIALGISDPTVEDISQTLAPYMRDYFQRDARFQDSLGLYASSYGFAVIKVVTAGRAILYAAKR